MADAHFSVKINGRTSGVVLKNVDFDESRDDLALEVGRALIDSAFNLSEGNK